MKLQSLNYEIHCYYCEDQHSSSINKNFECILTILNSSINHPTTHYFRDFLLIYNFINYNSFQIAFVHFQFNFQIINLINCCYYYFLAAANFTLINIFTIFIII